MATSSYLELKLRLQESLDAIYDEQDLALIQEFMEFIQHRRQKRDTDWLDADLPPVKKTKKKSAESDFSPIASSLLSRKRYDRDADWNEAPF